ncbi:hypothetical protein B0J12DRAFT_769532 [Macrophomina phaseolina]|uniref:Uncharacterized protein n=1 Tax=Macrophomina phaseolina TaxID=35725 RepID=A0ABQ8GLE8_9PEZI|nr:hypothetical protein B0J12DRAFT_769532 [Macrophomina phaseolina]
MDMWLAENAQTRSWRPKGEACGRGASSALSAQGKASEQWDLPAFRPQQQMSCCHGQAALFGVEAIVAGSARTGVPEGPEIGEDIDLLHASRRLADAFSASVQSIATAGKLKRSSEEVHAIAFSRQLAASTAHVKGRLQSSAADLAAQRLVAANQPHCRECAGTAGSPAHYQGLAGAWCSLLARAKSVEGRSRRAKAIQRLFWTRLSQARPSGSRSCTQRTPHGPPVRMCRWRASDTTIHSMRRLQRSREQCKHVCRQRVLALHGEPEPGGGMVVGRHLGPLRHARIAINS